MSVSTDAYLLYGIEVGEDLAEIAKALGIENVEQDDGEDDSEYLESLLEVVEKHIGKSLELVSAGHSEYPHYFIAAKGHEKAWRGYPKEIKSLKLKVSDAAEKKLTEFSKVLNKSVSYYLTSYADF